MPTVTSQRLRPVTLSLLTCLLLLVPLFAGCRQASEEENRKPSAAANTRSTLRMPDNGAYTGAYVDFGTGEAQVTYDALVDFEKLTGKPLAVVAFGNFWGERSFPAKTVQIVSNYGAVPMIYWSPWDKPYEEMRGPDKFSLKEIVAGKWDSYIDAWATEAKAYGKPILVAWGLEMNGSWFPWSGVHYGGSKVIGHKDGQPLYEGPELFKRAYRHVVDRVRARQASNILWGFHANNYSSPRLDWNRMRSYYPGAQYVDWLGLSVYGKMSRPEGWADFDVMMADPYQEICKLDPNKPIFLAEWGVGEFPPGDKAGFIAKAFNNIQAKYDRIRLAVYWHERWENKDGSYSNLRVNSSPEALEAYRNGVGSPYWIGRPQFDPAP